MSHDGIGLVLYALANACKTDNVKEAPEANDPVVSINVADANSRLSWDEYFASFAILTSLRSPSPKLRVGAIITKDNRVICTGYNGFFSQAPHVSVSRNGRETNTVHAEQNAIADAAKRGVSIDGATLYVTHYPCLQCTKMIIASGIRHVKYISEYKVDPLTHDMYEQTGIALTYLKFTLGSVPIEDPFPNPDAKPLISVISDTRIRL